MDRFASMHDEDIDKLGIQKKGAGEGGWKGRKRARELSELKGRLDRASEKEQQSWDILKQAVESGGSGSAVDEGRFKATGINRAAQEMRERTMGLVTAKEFRKAREAADSMEADEAKRRQEKEAAEEEAKAALKKKSEKKKRKAADKKKRLQKSKMSFALEEDDEEGGGQAALPAGDAEASAQSTKPAPSSPPTSEGQDGALRPDEATLASDGVVGADAQSANRGVSSGGGNSDAAPGVKSVADYGGGGSRSLKGAAPDGDNSRAASTLRERLGR